MIKRWTLVRLIVGTLLIAAWACAQAFAGNTGGLRGTVHSERDGVPIVNAEVTAIAGSVRISTHTDQHGFFALMTLPPGTVQLSIDASGYLPVSVPVCVQTDTLRTLPLLLSAGGGGSLPQFMRIQRIDARIAQRPNADVTADLYSIGDC